MENPQNTNLDFKHLILVWAFAESGIGGLLHALRLPFTGIFVGGIAVVCIALMGYFQAEKKYHILEALAIVLLVKLAISPHSPWQAYVAVIFQGYAGYWIFKSKKYYAQKVFLFSIVCLLESALQKLLITFLIFGQSFLKSIDAAAIAIFKALHLPLEASFVFLVFGVYIFFHLLTGIILGIWIPKIPKQIESMKIKMPEIFIGLDGSQPITKQKKSIYFGLFFILIMLLLIKIFVPEVQSIVLFWFFIRTLVISFALIFIVGPIIRSYISKKYRDKNINKSILDETLNEIPRFSTKALQLLKIINQSFSGWSKLKYMILGLLIIAMETNEKDG